MGKEWLQSFDRTGQTGSLEEQGQFRQRKFNGVQQWHLESIIRSLPNVLLLSVILFFAGVCLFLFSAGKAVAGVVIAFSGVGAVLGGGAIVAGATSPLCPHQSAASRALKRMRLLFFPLWWKDISRAIVDVVVRRPSRLVRMILDATHRSTNVAPAIIKSVPIKPPLTTPSEDNISEQVVIAQPAGWLFQTTSNRADQIAAAQFICTLNSAACVSISEDPGTWRKLVFSTHEALDVWHSRPSEKHQEIAELFGSALCHVLLQSSKDTAKMKYLTDLPLYQSRSFGGTFLQAFEFASTRYSCSKPEDKEMILHITFLLAIISRGQVTSEYQWARLSQFFLIGNIRHLVDVLLGL
ncbi:hypothetical protein M407DRAFT_30020 [Tulasnella calospora MUT 4182]|uniref:DUF6535 domain-containing protein n=1 Tax=Tulasnella calospora MUT 4182 TaxID=1051891 RepID=A0A0C3PYJ0_9AGAM|nr:hypothetical protein M407DRAFT_30020 [Tulasnella calospora MUT 4182]